MLRQVYSLAVFKVPFGSLGSSRSLLASVGSALELCETNLNDFSAQELPKVAILDSFFITFRSPGAYGRTALSLQSQHDPEGSGGSES